MKPYIFVIYIGFIVEQYVECVCTFFEDRTDTRDGR
jgi:hypothetical protein